MKNLRLYEEFASQENLNPRIAQIIGMFNSATNNQNWGKLSNWDEQKIHDAFLKIKTMDEYKTINNALRPAIEAARGKKYPAEQDFLYDIFQEGFIPGADPNSRIGYDYINPSIMSVRPKDKDHDLMFEIWYHLTDNNIIKFYEGKQGTPSFKYIYPWGTWATEQAMFN